MGSRRGSGSGRGDGESKGEWEWEGGGGVVEAYPAQQHLSLLVDGQRWNVVELKHGQQFCNHSEPWMNGVY